MVDTECHIELKVCVCVCVSEEDPHSQPTIPWWFNKQARNKYCKLKDFIRICYELMFCFYNFEFL